MTISNPTLARAVKNRTWPNQAQFYHIYPLGLVGAPGIDDSASTRKWRDSKQAAQNRLSELRPWVDHLEQLGCNSLYLGPLFQSSSHGYDTINYFQVDDRLGSNQDLQDFIDYCHDHGIQVVLDAVFNHVGRDFFAFQDLCTHLQDSMFCKWFKDIDFNRTSPKGDPFQYQSWHGHYDLVKLDTEWPWVREHLFAAVDYWIDVFKIDGLRLDAADCLSTEFIESLTNHCKSRKKDFLLLGEVVHGDYRTWAKPDRLDAVTNYEAYKSLWSSINDNNFFELAWTLNRQSGPEGMYREIGLYNFVDNHDVQRIASTLKQPQDLAAIYTILYTIPGTPAVYYGSEWGLHGQRQIHSDRTLRP
jgi:glycosidase